MPGMPLPTDPEIEAMFESPTAGQSTRITQIRTGLVAAAEQMRDRLGDGPLGLRALRSIQSAYITARASVLTEPFGGP